MGLHDVYMYTNSYQICAHVFMIVSYNSVWIVIVRSIRNSRHWQHTRALLQLSIYACKSSLQSVSMFHHRLFCSKLELTKHAQDHHFLISHLLVSTKQSPSASMYALKCALTSITPSCFTRCCNSSKPGSPLQILIVVLLAMS